MRTLFLVLSLCFFFICAKTQVTVSVSGHIANNNTDQSLFIGVGGHLIFSLDLDDDDSFSLKVNLRETPSIVFFTLISPKGNLTQLTPYIWFEGDSLEINFDLVNKTWQTKELLPFQTVSEKIESLKGKKQIGYILDNPNSTPSLFFANQIKQKIKLTDLEKFFQETNQEFKNTYYYKSINNYLLAKNREALRKGRKIEDFKLPGRDGQQTSLITGNGKKQIIAFLSSGCAYSIASIDFLEEFANTHSNIELTTIWDDPTEDSWLNMYIEKKAKITWTDLWDEYRFAGTYLNNYSWPSFYVVNEDGILMEVIRYYNKKTIKKLNEIAQPL